MRFVILVEGPTEYAVLSGFLRPWLDAGLGTRVGITLVECSGWGGVYNDAKMYAKKHLSQEDVIAVVSLMDLYGPTFYPDGVNTASQRFTWGKNHMEREIVNMEGFYHFFAVHELEAWLLSAPDIFPPGVKKLLPTGKRPETVNDTEPPAKLLNKLYRRATKKGYVKTTMGKQLFAKLDPQTAYEACPYFQQMMDKLRDLAKRRIADEASAT